MTLRQAFLSVLLGLALCGPASAQSFEEQVVRQLHDLGYSGITVSRTLLGRSRIKAESEEGRREIVLDPRTGVILRDYLYLRKKDGSGPSLPNILGGGNGGAEDDDDDREDNSGPGSANSGRDDDRDDDDHSGSGGGGGDNSGPGGGDDRDDDD